MTHICRVVFILGTCAVVMGCGKDQPVAPAVPGNGKKPDGKSGAIEKKGGQISPKAGSATAKQGPVKLPMPVMTAQKGKSYTHVAGFKFKYPADWTLKEHDDFLQMVPPDAKKNAQGPTEAYLILGDSVGG